MDLRIGYGYDVHQLAEGEELWLGGILVPSEFGAVGHSDADVLLHVFVRRPVWRQSHGRYRGPFPGYRSRLQRH